MTIRHPSTVLSALLPLASGEAAELAVTTRWDGHMVVTLEIGTPESPESLGGVLDLTNRNTLLRSLARAVVAARRALAQQQP